jgi:hypothetical protein
MKTKDFCFFEEALKLERSRRGQLIRIALKFSSDNKNKKKTRWRLSRNRETKNSFVALPAYESLLAVVAL